MLDRRTRLAAVPVIGACSALILSAILQIGTVSRGDFSAFYSAGYIAFHGMGRQLYDASLQSDLQARLWPDAHSGFYYFSYPPTVALLLSPLAIIPPSVAKAIFIVLSLLALWLAARLLASLKADYRTFHVFGLLLLFPTTLIGIAAGQNLAFVILCLAAYAWCFSAGRPRLAGLLLSLLWLKPHYGLIASGVVLSRRGRGVFEGLLVGILLQYAAGACLVGFDWPWLWIDGTSKFAKQDLVVNGSRMISLPTVAALSTEFMAASFVSANSLLHIYTAFSMFVFGVLLLGNFRAARAGRNTSVLDDTAQSAASILVLAPHVLFYDFGMSLLCVFALPARTLCSVFVLVSASVVSSLSVEVIEVQPVLLVSLAVLIYTWPTFRRESE